MSTDFLNDRRNSLEREFFSRQEAEALERLRAKNAAKAHRVALADAAGISDDSVLDALEAVGVDAESLSALALVPMVAVAWADGKLDEAEREAIQKAANEANPSGDASTLLAGWLSAPPDSKLLEAWKSYIVAVQTDMSPDARKALRNRLVGGARQVAEAAGGFLGFGNKISSEEATVLDELDGCFEA
jgi:hypothetical protein